jgi:hypothetical protein
VVLKVDSGADTTLMQECDCVLLGYTFDDCNQHSYYGINKQETVQCFIHYFNIKIGDFVINEVPISFSTKPIANPLLGRSKIFDMLDICFDSKNKHTLFATRP